MEENENNFYKQLKHSYCKNNINLLIPKFFMINGDQYSLYQIYNAVNHFGSFKKANNEGLWPQILVKLGISGKMANCNNIIFTLKCIYTQYLEFYETEDTYIQLEDKSELFKLFQENFKSRDYFSYADHKKRDLSWLNQAISGHQRLRLSLLSNIPNEIDFAINCIVILSHKSDLQLSLVPDIINGLVRCCGVQFDGLNISEIFNHQHFLKIWSYITPVKVFDAITGRSKEDYDNISFPSALDYFDYRNTIEFQRICQIGLIINNLTQNKDNIIICSKNVHLLKLLIIGSFSYNRLIRDRYFQSLNNIINKVSIKSLDLLLTFSILTLFNQSITSSDQHSINFGLNLFQQIISNQENFNHINNYIRPDTYEELLSLIYTDDIQVLTNILNCIYYLTLNDSSSIYHHLFNQKTIGFFIRFIINDHSYRFANFNQHSEICLNNIMLPFEAQLNVDYGRLVCFIWISNQQNKGLLNNNGEPILIHYILDLWTQSCFEHRIYGQQIHLNLANCLLKMCMSTINPMADEDKNIWSLTEDFNKLIIDKSSFIYQQKINVQQMIDFYRPAMADLFIKFFPHLQINIQNQRGIDQISFKQIINFYVQKTFTKSSIITCSLILKNILHYAPTSKKFVKVFEEQLCEMTFINRMKYDPEIMKAVNQFINEIES